MGQAIDIQNETEAAAHCNNEDIKAVDAINETADCHIDSYDSRGNISLHSAMQTMVPEPYSNEGKGSPSHLNMPGGHVLQGQKYLSDDLHNTHYQHTTTKKFSTLTIPSIFGQGMLQTCSDSRLNNQVAQVANMHVMNTSFLNVNDSSVVPNVLTSWLSHRLTYTQTRSNSNTNESQLSQRAKMKRAVKEYGATVVVFHVSISLVSLGGFYIAVSR